MHFHFSMLSTKHNTRIAFPFISHIISLLYQTTELIEFLSDQFLFSTSFLFTESPPTKRALRLKNYHEYRPRVTHVTCEGCEPHHIISEGCETLHHTSYSAKPHHSSSIAYESRRKCRLQITTNSI